MLTYVRTSVFDFWMPGTFISKFGQGDTILEEPYYSFVTNKPIFFKLDILASTFAFLCLVFLCCIGIAFISLCLIRVPSKRMTSWSINVPQCRTMNFYTLQKLWKSLEEILFILLLSMAKSLWFEFKIQHD